mmetsp:Transcript_1773/g.2755  ORF Transcript_1773/g.2755 Transcript_1773/m.2755 type:complete len:281 (+) Transcript_1773:2-844(+)
MLALITVGMHIEGGPESHNGAGMAISFLGLRLIMLFAYARVVFAYFPKREAWHTTFWTAVHVCFFLCLDSGIYLFAYYDTGNRRRCFWTVVVYNHMTSIRGLELVFSFGSSPQPCLLDDSYPDGQAEGVGADSNSADSEFKRVILQLRYSQWCWNTLIWYVQIVVMAFIGMLIFYLGYFIAPNHLRSSTLLLVLVLLMIGVIILNLVDEVVDNYYSKKVQAVYQGFERRTHKSRKKDLAYLKHSPRTIRDNLKALKALQDALSRRIAKWEGICDGDKKSA